jgi:DNA-binding GntR family transcriptional regulator
MEGNVLRLTDAPALLRDQALERLREAIIAGHFAPGTRLIERELCEQMGVSRTSIREVLRGLEAEHLITIEPRRGPIVARLTRRQVAIARAATAFIDYAMKVADHELIGDLQRKLIARVSVLRSISISQPGRLAQAEGELAAVMNAIEKREAAKAEQYFAAHIRNAGKAALARLDMGPLPTHVSMNEPSGSE